MPGPMRRRAEELVTPYDSQRRADSLTKVTVDPMSLTIPQPDEKWQPAAVALYYALIRSAMTQFWDSTDYMTAWMAADAYSYVLGQSRRSSDMLRVVTQMLNSIGANEGSRRAMGIELEHDGTTMAAGLDGLLDEALSLAGAEGYEVETSN